MAKCLLSPKCSSMYSDSLIKPAKQWQLISSHFLIAHQYSNNASSNNNAKTKIIINKKIQSPIATQKKVPIMRSSSSSITKNYSMYTEAKQQIASQSVQTQNNTTYFNDSLLASSSEDTSKKSTSNNNNNNNATTSQQSLASKKKSDLSESRERLNHLRYFYNDPEIDRAIEKPLIRLNPMAMMYMGVSEDNSHLLKSANYLRSEIPIR
jgi:hypothetical protein